MTIRLSEPADLPALMSIYDYARQLMQQNGNSHQWIDGYPSAALISEEITLGHSYVCLDEAGKLVGTFCFFAGPDPTYARIDEGEWLDQESYCVLHRLATSGTCRGVAAACLDWCFRQCGNLRVDTHHDNLIMQHILQKHGFRQCGIIYTHNGSPRLAYQKNSATESQEA